MHLQKYQQSNVVKTCQMKRIPVIRKQHIVVTRTITCGQMAGYVCEAEWTKPGGIKVCSIEGFYVLVRIIMGTTFSLEHRLGNELLG